MIFKWIDLVCWGLVLVLSVIARYKTKKDERTIKEQAVTIAALEQK